MRGLDCALCFRCAKSKTKVTKSTEYLVILLILCYAVCVVKRTCTAAPRFLQYERGVMYMSNVELLNTLLAVAGLVLSAYALGLQNRR